jgi:hypothetical protein
MHFSVPRSAMRVKAGDAHVSDPSIAAITALLARRATASRDLWVGEEPFPAVPGTRERKASKTRQPEQSARLRVERRRDLTIVLSETLNSPRSMGAK